MLPESGVRVPEVAGQSKPLDDERPAAIWTRRFIIAAFWAVAILLGLPHWNWTTSIPRSSLPLDVMNAWAEGRACQLEYPLHIAVQAPDLHEDRAALVVNHLQAVLAQNQQSRLHSFHVKSGTDGSTNVTSPALSIRLDTASAPSTPESRLRSWEPLLDVRHHLQTDSDIQRLAEYLASQIYGIFDDENASLWHLLKGTPQSREMTLLNLMPEKNAELERRTTRAFKYASTYHLTFSMFTPASSPSAWEIDSAIQEYISPLLDRMSSISEFTIDTQVQLYASFSPSIAGPVFDEEKQQWTLQYADLTGFINAAEWPLSPSIGAGPTINFVLYVPSPDKKPLLLAENGGASWIIPQWGAVQIHNGAVQEADGLTLEDLRPAMLGFTDQLSSLLGIPQAPPSLALRIASLTRERATSLILSASSTLGALSRLTLKLTSIAIPDTVAHSVDEGLLRLDRACRSLREGDYQNALENARIAETELEKAFFEPSMVGQVYFPEEHKVAVYVPLLGPMAVPLIMSGVKELRNMREKKVKTS